MRNTLYEIVWLRVSACLAVVLFHVYGRAYGDFGNSELVLKMLQLPLTFGTPAFVLIAEILTARAYPIRTKPGFMIQRFRYILIPYVTLGVVYGISEAFADWQMGSGSPDSLMRLVIHEVYSNVLLADYHGWFLIVVLQFALLHMAFARYLAAVRAVFALCASLVVQCLYLAWTSSAEFPFQGIGHLGWVAFPGWIGYFVAGYYIGSNYDKFGDTWRLFGRFSVLAIVSTYFLLLSCYLISGVPEVSSKLPYVFPFALAVAVFVLGKCRSCHAIGPWISILDRYSFSVFLLHPVVIGVMVPVLLRLGVRSAFVVIPIMFVCGIVCSIVVSALVNRARWGKYLVGRVGVAR